MSETPLKHPGRAILVVLPAMIFLGINSASEWLAHHSARAFDSLLTWAGYDL
ncbi:hypothetical protein LB565_04250 [Mesorhizobium sp. CA14]|uniref:hypothetical protein n=1 Tax=Mesorhizobium sp. CA14 TaxID=2876642 RepID=UPI001CCF3739|nr:hypothetical protein [Mesorhizobium sp. CA14]MBZ9847199.1 hypothetical protein [Mesorhizobium sp. CA14]